MMLEQKNTKKQGDVGLGAAIGWFTTQGYCVSIPLTDSQDYDLVVEIDNQLKKIQVKTTTQLSAYDVYRCELRTKGGNQSGSGKTKHFNEVDTDFLFVLTASDTKYLIPKDECPDKVLNLGKGCDKFKL